MSVSKTTEFHSPINSYSGTKYYDQGTKYNAEDFFEKRAVHPEDSLGSLFAKKSMFTSVLDWVGSHLTTKTKLKANLTTVKQNQHSSLIQDSPLAPSILPAKSIAFFAGYDQPDFHPYRTDKHHPVHQQLKKIVDHFEIVSRGLSLKEKLNIAEQIISEIRMADAVKYTKESSKVSMKEMHSQAKKALDEPPMSFKALGEYLKKNTDGPFSVENALIMPGEKSEEESSLSTLFEIGARYYLSCSLFKTQSEKSQTKTRDVASIYNFMTKNNTFTPYWGGMRLAMHPNLLGRIGANIADLLTVTDVDSTLTQANKLVDFYVNKMKNSINKSRSEDIVFLEGRVRTLSEPVQNKAIDIFLKSTEMTYRHALAKKIASSLAKSYKAMYKKSDALPQDVARTSAKITAFLQLSKEPAAIKRALHAPCDPADELINSF